MKGDDNRVGLRGMGSSRVDAPVDSETDKSAVAGRTDFSGNLFDTPVDCGKLALAARGKVGAGVEIPLSSLAGSGAS